MAEVRALSTSQIQNCLRAEYELTAASVEPVAGGLDLKKIGFQVTDIDGQQFFLSDRSDAVRERALAVPTALAAKGVPNLLVPIPTTAGHLWCECGGHVLTLWPFVKGKSAWGRGLTPTQWKSLAETFHSIHASHLGSELLQGVQIEEFLLPSARQLLDVYEQMPSLEMSALSAKSLSQFLQEREGDIRFLIEKGQTLGSALQAKNPELVLCHADAHLGNVLVKDDGNILLVDWEDGPILAPRERDLIFFVQPDPAKPRVDGEAFFLKSYGASDIDLDAIAYFRIERMLEDVAVSCRDVFTDTNLSEETKLSIVGDTPSFLGWL